MTHFDIRNPVNNLAGGDVSITNQYNYHGDKPNPLLRLATAHKAAFNAFGKDNDPQCLPNTRVQILKKIRTWADGDDGQYIFWLSGRAGTGKSTIARTIAREYYDKGCFTASFFFSRGDGDLSHPRKFVGTITSQLAQRCTAFKSLVVNAISSDEGISGRTIKDQWNELVLQPLSKLGDGSFHAPSLIVIDALDECEEGNDVELVLQLLRSLERFRFRVFITSRPDLPVRHGFSLIPDQDHQDFVLHDISRTVVDDDISLFLQHALMYFQQKHRLGEKWPGAETIKRLVQRAAGLFIWAATASRYIGEGGRLAPKRLSLFLQASTATTKPEEELDKIYTMVLENSVNDNLDQQEKEEVYCLLRETLGTIVVLLSPLPTLSLAELLHIRKEEVEQTMEELHSILDIPKDSSRPVQLHHPSLRDFLLDSQRCSDVRFWVDQKKAHEALANHCIQLMSDRLQKDICGLDDPGARVAQVSPKNLARCLPAELQYACAYWVDHVQRSEYQLCDDGKVYCFLRDYLLYWVEALSWIKQNSKGIHLIALLQSMVKSNNSPNLHAFLHDTKRFLLYNRSIIEEAPLQIYCCALVFAPLKSLVRKHFEKDVLKCIKNCPQIEEQWSLLVQTLEDHTASVAAVAFSPDGKLVASASYDATVRIWDAATGAAIETLKGHTNWVTAVTFSPDGKLVASASYDATVRIWDTATGAAIETLKGHTKAVTAVTFSPDGKLVASASDDTTVRIWDAATGAAIETLKGHTDWVTAVTFSPDGKLVASASDDTTVRIWDAATDTATKVFENWVSFTLAFSKDGLYLCTSKGALVINGDLLTMDPNNANNALFIKDNWIGSGTSQQLWLPLECRPGCSVFQDNLVALGLHSGIVKVIEF